MPQQEPGPASHLVTGRTVGRGATPCVPVLTPLSLICSHQILNHPQRLRHHPCLAEARGSWGPGGHGPFRPEALSAPTPRAVGLGPGLPGGVSLPRLSLPGSRVCVAPLSLPLPGWASSPRSQRPGSGTRCWSEPAQAGGRVVWGLSSQQPWQTEAWDSVRSLLQLKSPTTGPERSWDVGARGHPAQTVPAARPPQA